MDSRFRSKGERVWAVVETGTRERDCRTLRMRGPRTSQKWGLSDEGIDWTHTHITVWKGHR